MAQDKMKIRVFGKPGCDKCAVLNQRIDKLLASEQWKHMEKEYCDVETEDGIVALCESECINPQRLPAMLIFKWNESAQNFETIPTPPSAREAQVFGASMLYNWLGLQTDYSEKGRGLLTPNMIESCVAAAAAAG